MRVGSQKSGEKRRKKKTFTTEDTESTVGREGRKKRRSAEWLEGAKRRSKSVKKSESGRVEECKGERVKEKMARR